MEKNYQLENKKQTRLTILVLFLFFLFSLILGQFFKLQILEQKQWQELANAQHHLITYEYPKRGTFYVDNSIQKGTPNESIPLVLDIPVYSLCVDPLSIPKIFHEKICSFLNGKLSLSTQKIESQLKRKSRYRKLTSSLSVTQKEEILQWWKKESRIHKIPSNALYFIKGYQRSYPYGALLGQVLHAVRYDEDHKGGRWVPLGGLELYFNKKISGKGGEKLLIRSPKVTIDTQKILSIPLPGKDIHLSINPYLQASAELALEEGVKKSEAKKGSAFVIDPHTGQLWAVAHYPYFDPQKYQSYYKDPESLECTKPFGVNEVFEPGSLAKPFICLIAMIANDEEITAGREPLFDPSGKTPSHSRTFPGRMRKVKDVKDHKFLNMKMALQKSSNVYVAYLIEKIIERKGSLWLREKMHSLFHWSERTGIELPGEAPGYLPHPKKKYPSGLPQWSNPTPYSLAMGYNLLLSPLQMLTSFCMIANGGYHIRPTLLKKQCSKTAKIKPAIVHQVRDALSFVTEKGGSASLAHINGFTIAGKTSTSEKLEKGIYSKKKHVSSFVGMIPAQKPRFVVLVIVDEPAYKVVQGFGSLHYGGKCAGPIFRTIAKKTLEYLGVFPDFRYARSHEESKQLSEQYEAWN